jgi:hypothetical protein
MSSLTLAIAAACVAWAGGQSTPDGQSASISSTGMGGMCPRLVLATQPDGTLSGLWAPQPLFVVAQIELIAPTPHSLEMPDIVAVVVRLIGASSNDTLRLRNPMPWPFCSA